GAVVAAVVVDPRVKAVVGRTQAVVQADVGECRRFAAWQFGRSDVAGPAVLERRDTGRPSVDRRADLDVDELRPEPVVATERRAGRGRPGLMDPGPDERQVPVEQQREDPLKAQTADT